MSAVILTGPDGLTISVPPEFVELPDMEGPRLPLVVAPDPWPNPARFRPNLTVQVDEPTPELATLEQLSLRTVAGQHDLGVHVVSVDVWPSPPHPDGRRVVSLYPALDTTIVQQQYLAIRAGRCVTVGVQTDAGNYLPGSDAFQLAVATLSLDAPEITVAADPGLTPPLDAAASSPGRQLEDLSDIRRRQRFTSARTPLAPADVERLRGAGRRLPDPGEALMSAELVDAQGRLTDAGSLARDLLRKPQGEVRLSVSAPGVASARTFLAQIKRDTAVVVADPPPGEFGVHQTLDLIPARTIAIAACRWLAVAPAWAHVAGENPEGRGTVTMAQWAERMDDPNAPAPSGAGPALEQLWAEDWQLANLSSSVLGEVPQSVLCTSGSGYFEVQAREQGAEVQIAPLPSLHLARLLLALSGIRTNARPAAQAPR